MKTRKEIDQEIQTIFTKHDIKPFPGIEGFWDAVEDVTNMNLADGNRLYNLGKLWERTD